MNYVEKLKNDQKLRIRVLSSVEFAEANFKIVGRCCPAWILFKRWCACASFESTANVSSMVAFYSLLFAIIKLENCFLIIYYIDLWFSLTDFQILTEMLKVKQFCSKIRNLYLSHNVVMWHILPYRHLWVCSNSHFAKSETIWQ